MKTAKSKALLLFLLLLFVIYLCIQTKDCCKSLSVKIQPLKKSNQAYDYEPPPEKIITVPDKDKIVEKLKEDL